MSDLNIIKRKLDRYKSLDSSLLYLDDPVKIDQKKEYYKNGNVKAYISKLRISEIDLTEKVRNRDYYLYKENFNNSYNYLLISYYVYKYKQNTQYLYNLMHSYHKTRLYIYKDLDVLKQEKLDELNIIIQPNTPTLPDFPLKPNKYSKKYRLGKVFFGTLFRRREKKREKLKQEYKFDLEKYQSKISKIIAQSINASEIEFKYFVDLYNQEFKKNKIINKFDEIRKGFIAFSHEDKIREYIDIILSGFSHDKIYKNQKFTYEVDIDSNSVILNISVPKKGEYPDIADYKVVKKNLSIKPITFNKDKLEYNRNEALNSFVLSYINQFINLNISNTIKNVYLNLYYLNDLDIMTQEYFPGVCIHKGVVDITGNPIYKDETLRENIISLYGKFLAYEDFKYSVKPTKKGRI